MSSTVTSCPRAAIAQLCATSNKLQNLVDVAQCAGMAKEQGACMLFLPECFGFMGESAQQTLEQADPEITVGQTPESGGVENDPAIVQLLQSTVATAQPTDSLPSVTSSSSSSSSSSSIHLLSGLQTIARASGLWISGGGMHVTGAPPATDHNTPRVYNTHIILDNQGTVKSLYRKIHLFNVHIPEQGVNLQESKTTAPGTDLVVCESPIGTLGLTTCYDVRFPEQYLQLRQRGADILLVPSAFTVPTGRAHWHTLLRARAIEQQCYVLAAAQYGKHNDKRESYGHSLAVDPWGKVVADAGGCDDGTASPTTPSIITCDIDPELLASVRQKMPIQQHRADAQME